MINIKSKNLLVLIVEVEGDDPQRVLEELAERLNPNFFSKKGDFPFLIKAKKGTSPKVIEAVMEYLVEHGFVPLFYSEEGIKEERKREETFDWEKVSGHDVLIVNRTVRAGQLIEHPGDIIIVGDVNPDAEVRAAGNVMVFGELRGIAWAGYPGNKEAFILAFKMKPQQLRIANIFAPGEELKGELEGVHQAYVVEVDGHYEIEVKPVGEKGKKFA